MSNSTETKMLPYRISLAGLLLAARETVMAPIRPHLREAGVTEQQWRVLRVLSDEGPLDLSTLADHAMLHAPSVTRIIKELTERDLIHRAIDEADRRRSILELSDSGSTLIRATMSKTAEILKGYSEHFGRDRMVELREELTALIQVIESGENGGPG